MDLFDLAYRFGLPFALVAFALAAGARGLWVWPREVKVADERRVEAERRADKAERIMWEALRSGNSAAEVAVAVLKEKVS